MEVRNQWGQLPPQVVYNNATTFGYQRCCNFAIATKSYRKDNIRRALIVKKNEFFVKSIKSRFTQLGAWNYMHPQI